MDDTQKDGSDSDWDSTLDFTSPRQPNFMPRMQQEIEDEESALSNESDIEEENIDVAVHERNAVNNERNLLKTKDERSSPSPVQKENNIIKAQQQQTAPRRTPRQAEREASAGQYAQEKEPPPYNFREAVTGKFTPEPGGRGPPGKERKGPTYDPAPSPTPRGIPVQQGSIKSIGSWDESDPDEKTLRELRANFNKEKQKEEEQKLRLRELDEPKSFIEDAPPTNRSETTWKSWAKDKFQKKPRNSQQTQPQPQVTPQRTPQLRHQPRSPMQDASQMSQVSAQQAPLRIEVSPPSETHSYQYPRPSPHIPPPRETYSPQFDVGHVAATSYAEIVGEEYANEPKKLYVYDEDRGRYTYYFGHGNLKYFEVNDDFYEAVLPTYADKWERLAKRIWQEIFAVIRIIMSIFIWFFIELFRYVAKHIFQPIVHGIFATVGDFIFKPFLSALFNGFLQPLSIFFWNVFTGMRHMFRPIGEILERVFQQFAILFRSIRLFEITWITGGQLQRQQQVDANAYNPVQVI